MDHKRRRRSALLDVRRTGGGTGIYDRMSNTSAAALRKRSLEHAVL
jgi:hypothetical protein